MNKNILINLRTEDLNRSKKSAKITDFIFPKIELKDQWMRKSFEIIGSIISKNKSATRSMVLQLIRDYAEFDAILLSLVSSYVGALSIENKPIAIRDIMVPNDEKQEFLVDSKEAFEVLRTFYPIMTGIYQSDIIDMIKRTPGTMFIKTNKHFAQTFLFVSTLIRFFTESLKVKVATDNTDSVGLSTNQLELIKNARIDDIYNLADKITNRTQYKTIILDKSDNLKIFEDFNEKFIRKEINSKSTLGNFVKAAYNAYTNKGIFQKLGSVSYVANIFHLNISTTTIFNIEEIVDIKTFRDRDWVYDTFMALDALDEYDTFYYDARSYIKMNVSSRDITGFDFTILIYQLVNGETKYLMIPSFAIRGTKGELVKTAIDEFFKVYTPSILRMTDVFANIQKNIEDLKIELSLRAEDLSKEHIAKSKVMTERHYKNQTILVNGHIRTYKNGDQTLVCSHLRNYGEADKKRILSSAYTVISLNK